MVRWERQNIKEHTKSGHEEQIKTGEKTLLLSFTTSLSKWNQSPECSFDTHILAGT